MAADSKPLAGRRIVITRAAEQAEELVRRLQELGAETLLAPMVRFAEPEETGQLDQAIAALAGFDWLIFTSANTVRFFLQRCRERGHLPGADGPRIAAVGVATQDAVEAEGLRVALVPGEFSGAGLAAKIAGEVSGKKVLLPRSDRAGEELPTALRAAGASVTETVAYRTVDVEKLDPALRMSLLRGEVDAITFFSPSAFEAFTRALGDASLREVGARMAFAAVGPVTAAAVRRAGVEVAVEAAEATSASLVAALEHYFSLRPAGVAARQKERN